MKNIFHTLILAAAVLACSCSDWLDVNPKGEMKEADIFTTEAGFKSVLTGVYIRMASTGMYGRMTTVYLPELLAQHWDTEGQEYATEKMLRNYNFRNPTVEATVKSLWDQYFSGIVNLNGIINNIDGKEHIFGPGNYGLIKGEALGLRAFLHFEVLRLWGPVPAKANRADLSVPYITHVTKEPELLLSTSYGEALDRIIADLEAAAELLADDPVRDYELLVLNTPSSPQGPADDFHYYRKNRFNYYAVKATMARYWQWMGGHDKEAAACANEVIDAALRTIPGQTVFRLADNSILGGLSPDRIMNVEHIFAVHNKQLPDSFETMFGSRNPYTMDRIQINTMQEPENAEDVRIINNNYWYDALVEGYPRFTLRKYYNVDTRIGQDQVPVIRLAEMYLIAMECGTLAEANQRFNEFKIARRLNNPTSDSFTASDQVRPRVEKELRKDFYGEGLMFYYYKRHDVAAFTWPNVANVLAVKPVYVLPKPEEQTKFE